MLKIVRSLAFVLILATPLMLKADVPLDFDGDGISDLTIYRNGAWWIQRSSAGLIVSTFGQSGDTLVPADYDGDGITDRAIWRNGVFWIQRSTAGLQVTGWGQAGDEPRVVADYDGDGIADLAIYRPSTATYWIRRSSDLGTTVVPWGLAGDLALPGNFVGNLRADFCVFRPSNNTFYVLDGQTSVVTSFVLGNSATDRVVAMNRVGTALIDFAVFRNSGPNAGDWYSQSTQGASLFEPAYGLAGDLPLPFVETAGATSSLTLVRNQSGQLRWYRRQLPEGNFSNVAFGLGTDIVPGNTFFTR